MQTFLELSYIKVIVKEIRNVKCLRLQNEMLFCRPFAYSFRTSALVFTSYCNTIPRNLHKGL